MNNPKKSTLISEDCWNYYESKRKKEYSNRPPMPKNLPQTHRTIFDPPWIWDTTEIPPRYIPNVMNFMRSMIDKSMNNSFQIYEPNRKY